MRRNINWKSAVFALALALSLVCGWLLCPHDSRAADAPKAPKTALQRFMHAKLGLSQDLIEGLVVEDFDKLDKSAKALLLLSVAEEWNVKNDPLYKQHSEEFRRAVKQVSKSAQDKNLDGASLSFVQVTMSCIECHRYVRNQAVVGR